jgi:hypothetical protein
MTSVLILFLLIDFLMYSIRSGFVVTGYLKIELAGDNKKRTGK